MGPEALFHTHFLSCLNGELGTCGGGEGRAWLGRGEAKQG